MANIEKDEALEQIQQAVANLYLDRIESDFWGRTTLEIVWENGVPRQVYVESKECVRIVKSVNEKGIR